MYEQESKMVNLYDDSVRKLSKGLLEKYQDPFEQVQSHLKELTLEQNKIISQIHSENLALTEHYYSPELQQMLKKMNVYHDKLLNIKKNMKHLHERSTRLKTRALKMEQYTEKLVQKKIQKEMDLTKEEELIGAGPSKLTEKSKDNFS